MLPLYIHKHLPHSQLPNSFQLIQQPSHNPPIKSAWTLFLESYVMKLTATEKKIKLLVAESPSRSLGAKTELLALVVNNRF